MKQISFVLFFMVLAVQLKAQHQLKGNVKSKNTQEGLADVTVYIPDLKTATITNQTGEYKFSNLPEGKFLVEYKKNMYNTVTIIVEVKGETVQDIVMDDEVVEMHEVTVTGTSQSTAIHENPVAISTIGQQELFQNTSTNIIDNISKTPGVNQLSTGAAISKPIIRGLGYNRIVTLYNGIRQEGQQWGDEHGIELDEFSIDRVEIIKGPGSLMYGSDALAGVVNFLSPNPLPLGQIKTTAMAHYQTNNHLQAYSLSNAGNLNGFNWLLRGTSKQAGNYRNVYDGYVYNSGFKELDVNGYLGLNKKWGYSHLHFSTFNQTIAMPEGERDSLGNFIGLVKVNDTLAEEKSMTQNDLKGYRYDLPQQTINHLRLVSVNKFFFGKTNLAVHLGYQQNHRKEFGDVLEPQTPELFFDLKTFHADIRYQLPEVKNWQSTIGLSSMQQSNRNKGEEVIIPEYDLLDVGAFVFTKKQLGKKMHLAGGIRYDYRNISTAALYLDTLGEAVQEPDVFSVTRFAPVDVHYQALTGSVGITAEFSEKFSGKFNLARGFRSPNLSEITSNGKHEGSLRYELGDASLKPETSLQADLGLCLETEHVSGELSVFYNDIQNYVYARKLVTAAGFDSIANPLDPAPVYRFTQGHAFLYGGEFSIDVHPHPLDWLHIENSISMVNGVMPGQPDSMRYLPFIPPVRYQGELRCEFKKKTKRLQNMYVSFLVTHFMRQDKVYSAGGTETPTPAYTLLNTGIGANLVNKKGKTVCSITLSANNLLDVAYQNHLSRLKYAPENTATGRMGIFNMGRNFGFKVLIPIENQKSK